jgi:hypothetical protein
MTFVTYLPLQRFRYDSTLLRRYIDIIKDIKDVGPGDFFYFPLDHVRRESKVYQNRGFSMVWLVPALADYHIFPNRSQLLK